MPDGGIGKYSEVIFINGLGKARFVRAAKGEQMTWGFRVCVSTNSVATTWAKGHKHAAAERRNNLAQRVSPG